MDEAKKGGGLWSVNICAQVKGRSYPPVSGFFFFLKFLETRWPHFLRLGNRNRYSEGTEDAQKTPHGHPDFNFYVQNLRVFIFQTDRQTDGQTDGEINPVWAG